MKNQPFSKTISLTFGILVVCFAVGFYTFAVWQEPSQEAPEGNAPTPVNTGTQSQSKAGMLSATVFGDADNPDYYLNPSGESKLETICLGADCKDAWPETGIVVTYQMNTDSYMVGNNSYSQTVQHSCPEGSDAVQVYCKEAFVNLQCAPGLNACTCSISGNTAQLKAWAVRRWEGESTTGCEGISYALVDSCVYNPLTWPNSCSIANCQMEFQCGVKQTVGE